VDLDHRFPLDFFYNFCYTLLRKAAIEALLQELLDPTGRDEGVFGSASRMTWRISASTSGTMHEPNNYNDIEDFSAASLENIRRRTNTVVCDYHF
jgi:hypothetical protein